MYRPCRAVDPAALFQHPTDAPPDCGLFASVVPFNPSVNISAVSAKDHARQSIFGTIDSPFTVRQDICSPDKLRLYPEEYILIDYRLMTSFHVVFWCYSIIHHSLFVKYIYRICLLKECITDAEVKKAFSPSHAAIATSLIPSHRFIQNCLNASQLFQR